MAKIQLTIEDCRRKLEMTDTYIQCTLTYKGIFEDRKETYVYELVDSSVPWKIGKRLFDKLVSEGYEVRYQ